MKYLDQIQSLADWEYCSVKQYESDHDWYIFGWKDGLHFYFVHWPEPDELGEFQLDVWLNKQMPIPIQLTFTFEEIVDCITKLLDENIIHN
jgi:hypothetical protein